jgi:hypothetical protein
MRSRAKAVPTVDEHPWSSERGPLAARHIAFIVWVRSVSSNDREIAMPFGIAPMLVSGVVAALVSGALPALPATPAGATSLPPVILAFQGMAVSPAPVVLGPRGGNVGFDVMFEESFDLASISIDVFDGAGSFLRRVPLSPSGTTWDPVFRTRTEHWKASMRLGAAYASGRLSTLLVTTEPSGAVWRFEGPSPTLVRATRVRPLRITTKKSGEQRRKVLLRAQAVAPGGGWMPSRARQLAIEFRGKKKKKAGWRAVDHVWTGRKGRAVYRTANLRAGSWRAVAYDIDGYAGVISAGKKVRRRS